MKFRIVEGDLESFIAIDREASWSFVDEEVKQKLTFEEYCVQHRKLVETLYNLNMENKIFLAVSEEGKVLGAAWVGIRLDSVNYVPIGYLYDIEVIGEARGVGVGSALLAAIEKFCRARKVERIALLTPVSNAVAIKWYEKRGFQVSRLYLEKKLD
ncbi:MAG: GNAT family N-acetyltransferase [Thermofilaceae archaeon]|nr:GNAT family N-acetyltransferase [Thermofilaceae archaeon]MCX8180431.1 GNAT family N-acetyltransferase [Thermofilaceae archaeon]MDW8003372.1 GNAT family N-acetyltransferase [Thermofilaceae archaeon]